MEALFYLKLGKPQQARCESKNPLNEQNAIYGSNSLRFALLFAFEKLPKNSCSWAVINENGTRFGELRDSTYIDENAKGYIYCYDKSKFQETKHGSSQFVCFHDLAPQRIIEVEYKDYKDLFVSDKKEMESNL